MRIRQIGMIDYAQAFNLVWSAWQSGKLYGTRRLLVDLGETTLAPHFDYEGILGIAQAIAQITHRERGSE